MAKTKKQTFARDAAYDRSEPELLNAAGRANWRNADKADTRHLDHSAILRYNETIAPNIKSKNMLSKLTFPGGGRFSGMLVASVFAFSGMAFGQSPTIRDGAGDRFYGTTHWVDFNCTARWNQTCEQTYTLPMETDEVYCIHEYEVNALNNGWFRIETAPDKVVFRARASGSGVFFDQYGANYSVRLIVGGVKKGEKNVCLPSRSWAAHHRGKIGGSYSKTTPCFAAQPLAILKDENCRSWEAVPATWFESMVQKMDPSGSWIESQKKKWKEKGLIPD